jgi:hypothetical protein
MSDGGVLCMVKKVKMVKMVQIGSIVTLNTLLAVRYCSTNVDGKECSRGSEAH